MCARIISSTLTITLNGDSHVLAGPQTVAELLAALDIDARRVAVEHNQVVVRRDAYGSTTIHEGDAVEIVNFVGGGEIADLGLRIADCGLRIRTDR